MRSLKRIIATLEIVLIFPAALFMTALVVRNLGELPYEPAATAQRIILWCSGHEYAQLATSDNRSQQSADGRMAKGAAWLKEKNSFK
jgi:hypothetical protein